MTTPVDDTPRTFALDDEGTVARFVDTYQEELMFVSQYRKWFYWTGQHWSESIGQETEAAMAMVQSMHAEARTLLAMGDMERYKRLTQHIVRTAGRLPYIVNLASKTPMMRSSVEWLDQRRSFINCGNMTLDLRDDTETVPDPRDRLTKRTGALYLPNAPRVKWEQFLSQVLPDPQMREYVQRLVGYSLLGDVQERIIVFLHGTGRNGKSVFVEAVREVLGDYACGTPVTTFLKKPNASGPSNDLARLRGARFVAASEFEEGAKVNTALLKQVTGDEKITARPMYGEYFDFPFEGTIWVSTNHMPFVGTQQAVWDRIKTVPFTTRIPENQVDVRIREKLLTERSGILSWIIEGARAYLAHGLDEPGQITEIAMDMRHDQDLLGPFVDECCEIGQGRKAFASELYRTYTWWAVQNGEKPITARTFGLRLADAGYLSHRGSGGARMWVGLSPKTSVVV